MLGAYLKPGFEKKKQILKNDQIISAYHIDNFASKMAINKRRTTNGLMVE